MTLLLQIFLFSLYLSKTFGLFNIDETSTGQRIVGGNPSTRGRWPFMAAIDVQTSTSTHFCGGAYLGEEWVITAAQCVDGATHFTIVMGNYILNDETERALVTSTEYIMHPDYNSATLENDLALIRIQVTFNTGPTLQPISLLPTDPIDTDYLLTMLGWGAITDGGSIPVNDLRWNTVIAISNAECRAYFGNQIKDSMVCVTGYFNSARICEGDSGGPLVQYYGTGVSVIIGVASFIGALGCESGYPSGFTRIYEYNDWIRNITGHA